MSAAARQRLDRLTGAVAAAVAAGIALSVLGGVLSGGAWPWVVATYLRWPQVIGMTLATVALVVTRWWRTGVVAAVVTAGLIASVVAPVQALRTVEAPDGRTLRVAVFNTGARDNDVVALAEEIAAAQPDVVVLLESEDIAERLDRRLDGLRWLRTPVDTPVTSAPIVFARRPWPVEVVPLAEARPATVVTAEIDGALLDIVAIHPLPPMTPGWARSHNRSYDALIERVLPREHPYVVACDCNSSPWSPTMGRLLDLGLRGPTVAATFGAPLVGVPIDHVLLSRRVAAVSRDLGSFAGSDHRLIVTEVTLER